MNREALLFPEGVCATAWNLVAARTTRVRARPEIPAGPPSGPLPQRDSGCLPPTPPADSSPGPSRVVEKETIRAHVRCRGRGRRLSSSGNGKFRTPEGSRAGSRSSGLSGTPPGAPRTRPTTHPLADPTRVGCLTKARSPAPGRRSEPMGSRMGPNSIADRRSTQAEATQSQTRLAQADATQTETGSGRRVLETRMAGPADSPDGYDGREAAGFTRPGVRGSPRRSGWRRPGRRHR